MAQLLEPPGLPPLHLEDRHTSLGLSGQDLVAMYRTMLLTRVLDQRIWALNRMGKAPFVISSQGHEGAQVGSAWAIAPGRDVVLPYYRDLGVVLTVGMTAYEVLLGVFAKAEDPSSGGRQMPSHWGSRRLGIISGSSPIATHLPHAAGIAKAMQLRGDDGVVVCYFGDGAASKGDFHEACNFAGIHRLPLVLVCENNGYAISVPLDKESAVSDIAVHAHSYGFTGVIVDGNDPLDCYGAVHGAVRRARRGEGPTLVECKTYRYLAHTSDDDDRTYRSPEEVERWRKKDPLGRLRQYLIEQRLLPESLEEELEEDVRSEVAEALAKAEAAPDADPATVLDRVFAVPAAAGPPPPPPPADDAPERTIVDTVREVQRSLLEADDRVVILGEDVGPRGGVFRATDGLYAEFGERRVMDTPLAESAIIGIAIGMALAGLRPIAEIQFADFIHAAFDQLVSEAAKMRYRSNGDFSVPLVVRVPWGGGVHGALYHSQAIEAFYAHVAGLKVVAPSTPSDVAGLLRAAVADEDPVLFLEHKKTYRAVKGPVPPGDWTVPIGKAAVARPGTDATIVTYGIHRHLAVEAAEQLASSDGIELEVIDLRTICPLDTETVLSSVGRTGRALVVHEDNRSFGVGAEVAAVIASEAFYDLDAPVRRLAMPDVPAMAFAPALERAVTIGAYDIASAARALVDE
ncbi:MAG TPA: dehydrogenase E1 component subunit alpha/beta [Acidimicrobiales bacterium]|nr:dehydrogenase E1 component subunit alpha/beta [Acidimicrobiales bacterium]